jgi:hypothetical protein
MIPGTNKDIDLVLKNTYEVLLEKNKVIVTLMQKIEEINRNQDYLHDELKKCF